MRTDGRKDGLTDMTKLMGAFRNFANAPKHQGIIAVFTKYRRFNSVHNLTPSYVDPGRSCFTVHVSSPH
jgi:hypothetical protein